MFLPFMTDNLQEIKQMLSYRVKNANPKRNKYADKKTTLESNCLLVLMK